MTNEQKQRILETLVKAYRMVIFAEERLEKCKADHYLACDAQYHGAVTTFYGMLSVIGDLAGYETEDEMRQAAIKKASALGAWVG